MDDYKIEEIERLLGNAVAQIEEVINWTDYESDVIQLEESLAEIMEVLKIVTEDYRGEEEK